MTALIGTLSWTGTDAKPCMSIALANGAVSALQVVDDLALLRDILLGHGVSCNWGGDFAQIHRVYGVPRANALLVMQIMNRHYARNMVTGQQVVWHIE